MSSNAIEVLSPAKLNLFLHVTGRQANGYHELQTVFQLLNWGDTLRFELSDIPGVHLTSDLSGVTSSDNLIIRAANLLSLPSDAGVSVTVDKVIPMGGGLGGGSSNAAVTMLALNKLLALGYSVDEMANMGAALGADVPVFVRGQSAWGEGIGEKLTPIELPNRWYVIIYPNCHVSTQEIFTAPELTRNTPPITVSAFFDGAVRNDLQPVVEARYEPVKTALEWLSERGSAMMTGSGACVFAAYDEREIAEQVAGDAAGQFKAFVAEGINRYSL